MRVLALSVLYRFCWPPFFLGHPYIGSSTLLPDNMMKNNRAVLDLLVLPPDEGEPNAAECFVHKYLVHVLVVLAVACAF